MNLNRFRRDVTAMMIPSLIAIVIALLLTQPLVAREDPNSMSFAEKEKRVREVYDNIVKAFGHPRKPPTLVFLAHNNEVGMIAWMRRDPLTITIEESAFNLCYRIEGGGDNALAVLLGHELAHFYENHFRWEDFKSRADSLQIYSLVEMEARSSATGNSRVLAETEADVMGGFAGYIAGYNTLDIGAAVIEALYTEFDIPKTKSNMYPSLLDRQQLTRDSEKQLQSMVKVFEAGNRLLLLNRFEEAARCFDYLSQEFEFPSREFPNNAGVARALQAVSLITEFAPDSLDFIYPFEFDAQTRLNASRGSKGWGGESKEQEATRLLSEAARDFKRAIDRDENYATAYLNLACVYQIQRKFRDADYYAEKAIEIAEDQNERLTASNALIARGIIHASRGSEGQRVARDDFEKGKQGNNQLASLNLERLAGGKNSAGMNNCPDPEKLSMKSERIGEVTPLSDQMQKISGEPTYISGTQIPGTNKDTPTMGIAEVGEATWNGHAVHIGDALILTVSTPPGYTGPSARGVSVGNSLDQVAKLYGCPTRIRNARQGNYQVYEKSKIIFVTDASDKVTGWMLYAIGQD